MPKAACGAMRRRRVPACWALAAVPFVLDRACRAAAQGVESNPACATPAPEPGSAEECTCEAQLDGNCTAPCKQKAGCPTKSCVPPADGFTCDECDLDGLKMICDEEGTPPGTIMLVVYMVITVVLVVSTVVCALKHKSDEEQPGSPQAKKLEARIANQKLTPANAVEKWRVIFLRGMFRYGAALATHRKIVGPGALIIVSLFATGATQMTIGISQRDWAPEGGRLERELEYTSKWGVSTQGGTSFAIMIGPEDSCIDLRPSEQAHLGYPTRKYLELLVLILNDVSKITTHISDRAGTDMEVGWKDFCLSIDHPLVDTLMPGTKPCTNPSILDCFWEGAWQIEDVNMGMDGTAEDWIANPPEHGPYVPPFGADIDCPEYTGELPTTLEQQPGTCPPNYTFPSGHPNQITGWPVRTATQESMNLFKGVKIAEMLAPGQLGLYRELPGIVPGSAPKMPLRPSFRNLTDQQLYDALNKYPYDCKHWLVPATQSRNGVFGGWKAIPRDECEVCGEDKKTGAGRTCTSCMKTTEKIVAASGQYNPMRIREYRPHMCNVDDTEIKRGIKEWMIKVTDRLQEFDEMSTGPFAGSTITTFGSITMMLMFENMGEERLPQMIIGYLLMLVFAIFTQIDRREPLNNMWHISIVGIILVMITNLASFGFCSICGMEMNHMVLQVLPFLALGLGVDDMFLLMQYYKDIEKKRTKPTSFIIGELLEHGGTSVTLTSLSNAFAFFIGNLVPIPALRAFLTCAGVVVMFNYLTMLHLLPVIFAFHTECNRGKEPDRRESNRFVEGENPSLCSRIARAVSVHRIVVSYVAPFLAKRTVTMVVNIIALLFLLFAIVALHTFAPLDYGFDITDYSPQGTYLAKGLSDYMRLVQGQAIGHSYIVTGNVDIATHQTAILKMHRKLTTSKWAPESATSFMPHWLSWFHGFAAKKLKLNYPPESSFYNTSAKEWQCREEYIHRPEGTSSAINLCPMTWYVNASDFYETFHCWRDANCGGLMALEAMVCDDFGMSHGTESRCKHNEIMMNSDSYSIDIKKLQRDTGDLNDWDCQPKMGQHDPAKWVEHMDDMREIMLELGSTSDGANVFPSPSGDYERMEQYASLRSNFWIAYGASCAILLTVGVVVPVSFRGSVIIMITAATGVLELAALTMMAGLMFNPILAAGALLTGMGVIVDPSLHMVAAFEMHSGTREQRLEHALTATTVPIIEGAISTFLGFVMMSFSPFPYVFKYFFLAYLLLIILALIHGLLFVPALCSLAGSQNARFEEPGLVSSTQAIAVMPELAGGPTQGSAKQNPLAVSPPKEDVGNAENGHANGRPTPGGPTPGGPGHESAVVAPAPLNTTSLQS